MKLEDLKEFMLLPNKEYLINQSINIKGTDVHLLSFTIEEGQNRLWFAYEQDNPFEDELSDTIEDEANSISKTNREEKLKEIEGDNLNKHFHIDKMEIQNQVVTFNSSSGSQIHEGDIQSIMQLQHFVERGLMPKGWNDKELRNLVISNHRQSDDDSDLIIDSSKPLNIKLSTGSDTKEISIGHTFKADFGKQNTQIKYFDKELGREQSFYINEIYSFDPYENIKTSVEKIEDLETRKEVFNNLTDAAKRIYPKDKNLAVIKYETNNDTQLNFYMKDFLDRDPKANDNGLSYENEGTIGSASFFIWSSKEEGLGVNGYKLRECMLQAIDKDFNGEVEMELFSRYLEIPGEEIR